jgi:glycogen debranching enzyme
MTVDELAPNVRGPIEWGEVEEPRTPQRMFALKDRDTFVVADSHGDILGAGDGVFHDDTRILSRWELLVDDARPTLLSGAISQDNVVFTAQSLNKALPAPGGPVTPPGILHIERKRFVWEERIYERVRVANYGTGPVTLPLAFEFDADFYDMFEVRGARRPRRGVRRRPQVGEREVSFRYDGLDGVERSCVIAFSETPERLSVNRAEFVHDLATDSRLDLLVEIGAHSGPPPSLERHRAAAARARWAMRARRRHGARLTTGGRLFNNWIEKSVADLALLTTSMETGPYPYAGIPWFSTAFGRDGILTAWQVLWFDPSLAQGVLTYLASHQAEAVSAFRDSQPGKIMHETRRGEMAALGEVPFGRYYGGVDTTPLFVALAGAYAARTGDFAFIERLWPSLERAMNWIVSCLDTHPDGLLAYARGRDSGLSNQGWKDSGDSIFHADGRFPVGPIALVEVQGYVYAAMCGMAELSARVADAGEAAGWAQRAERLRERVEQLFWMDDLGFYAIALDGEGAPCRVCASNPGHLLFTGLPSPERARRVAEHLLSPSFCSGWGVRTLAKGQPRYNPMSYHNGSVWPHDTAICALGLARYGEREGVVRLTAGMFEAAVQLDMRLPELLCGFPRQAGEPPTPYPVACLPQAWAAGSVFMMLQACLGLTIDGVHRRIEVCTPHLPIGIGEFNVAGLAVGGERVNLRFNQAARRVDVRADSRSVEVDVIY